VRIVIEEESVTCDTSSRAAQRRIAGACFNPLAKVPTLLLDGRGLTTRG
jgi:hypothetical protein